jgi:putative ABC transport system substrate-binding protein
MEHQSRRRFLQGSLALTCLGLLGGCGSLPFQGRGPTKVPRVGVLWPLEPVSLEPFQQGLRDLGYVDGQNIILEYRYQEGQTERLPALAAELVALPVDVLVTTAAPALRAAQQATAEIPIVMAPIGDAVDSGFVRSLDQPGGNTTGLSFLGIPMAVKQLELLRDAVPGVSRVATIRDATTAPLLGETFRQIGEAARALGIELEPLLATAPDGLAGAFEAARAAGVGAVHVHTSASFYNSEHRRALVDLAARAGLPTMYSQRAFPEVGGLLSYGANLLDLYYRAATYVDKILKGARPADLPVEQPRTFDFVVNLKTAQALGLTIPPTVLAQATEIIQ